MARSIEYGCHERTTKRLIMKVQVMQQIMEMEEAVSLFFVRSMGIFFCTRNLN